MKYALLTPLAVLALLTPLRAATYTLASNTFSTADTQGWTAAGLSTLVSGTEDTNFATSSPVLASTATAGSPAGTNVRGVLAFPTVVLAATGDFLSISFDIRFTNTLAADRRFQTAFYSSATSSGYISQMKAGTATGSSTFFDQAAVPATGVMNGGTSLAATGATTSPLTGGGSSTLPIVHNATLTLTKTDTGVAMSFSAMDDTATLRTFDAADTVSPFTAFDRFSLTVWGNTVSYNLDNVVVTSNVPEPSAMLLSAFAAVGMITRRRSRR